MKFCPICDQVFDADVPSCPEHGGRLPNLPEGHQQADLLVGQLLAERYELEERIGQGGMGAIYRGRDQTLGREVAVKVLRANLAQDPDQIRRFFHEARTSARLRHPNTIQVFDFGESERGEFYIAMELMRGEALDRYLEHHALSPRRMLEILDQICLALQEAHHQGIIHRDLKPDNVFIDTVNQRRVVKVIDFGIAKQLDGEKMTQTGMVFGTPAYMSPEQASGHTLDGRSDLYAMGAVLFYMLTRRTLYRGDSAMEIAIQHLTQPVPDVQEISVVGPVAAPVISVLHALLAKSPDDRPADAEAARGLIAAAIAELDDPGDVHPTLASTAVPARARSRRLRVAALGGLTLVAVLLSLLVAVTLARRSAERGAPPAAAVVTAVQSPAPAPRVEPAQAQAQARMRLHRALDAARQEAADARVAIRLESAPPGAQVLDRVSGADVGRTPLTLHAARTGDPLALRWELAGHAPLEGEVPRSEGTHTVALIPRETTSASAGQGGVRSGTRVRSPAPPRTRTTGTVPGRGDQTGSTRRRPANLRAPITLGD
jgi:serine/threonine-protein kinase